VSVNTALGVDLTWDVYVKDANGCVATSPRTIIKDNVPTVSVPSIASNQCTVASGFTFTATGLGGVAPLSYSIDGLSFQAAASFTVAPGSYTVTVKDANGCTATSPTLVVYSQLTASSSVSKTLDCSASPSAGITVNVSGGKSAFSYKVKVGAGVYGASTAVVGSSFVYTAAAAGTYTFEITDANSCKTETASSVSAINNPTVSATPTQVSCFGGTNGSVTLVGAAGSGSGYTYSFNGSAFSATATYGTLSAGTAYAYQVKDSNGCSSAVGSITLTQPTALVATHTVVPFSCDASNAKVSGSVTINVPTTGTAPYEYSFNGGGYTSTNTQVLNDNGSNQTVTYTVRDAKGCLTASQSATVNKLNPVTDLSFAHAAVTCTTTTTTVTLTATNGVGALQYETIAPSASIIGKQASNVFAGLSAGNYTFKATDANGCFYTESYSIAPVTPIVVIGNKTSDVLCKGGSTGAISFTVSGTAVVGAYTYTLTTGVGTITKTGNSLSLPNLVAGSYSVTVTDTATGCTASSTVVITEPAVSLSLSATATNTSCNNHLSNLTVTPAGGTAPYSYAAVKAGAAAPLAAAYQASNVVLSLIHI
jgi:hypothetical protein